MNRKFKPNRQGITLLFVISMIVLFLLMGTAFVVVSNNFKRESTNRIRTNVPEGRGPTQSNQLIEEAIYQALRGTPLTNVDSPLRTNDILADAYGYGVRSFVSSSRPPTFVGVAGNVSPFIELALSTDSGSTDNLCFNLRTLETAPVDPNDPSGPTELVPEELSPNDLSGTFGGRVLSFTSGPAQGFSVRILADAFDSIDPTTGAGAGNLVFRIPTSSISGDTITSLTDLAGSEVIINGRDFSGAGAAAIFDNDGQPTSLGAEAAMPNRIGESHATLLAYLNSSNSVNEPWDAADVATPFLSGFDRSGGFLPSFHSDTSFRAFNKGTTNLPDVDTDGDGVNDAYWMDLGMAVVTNAQGQRFRPLVAIHIRDMDGLLNVNAHGNRTHLRTDGFVLTAEAWAGATPGTPRGSGMGTPEINLTNALGGTSDLLEELLNSRYGSDNLPGDGPSFRSRAKLFGHPSAEVNNGGTVGNLYGTAMDIHGRFRIGTPATTAEFLGPVDPTVFNSSLPQIDMLTTRDIDTFTDEFSGNPYEFSISGKATGDNPFTLQELESILRPNDIDSRILPNRLSNLLSSAVNTKLFTTDSFDVPMPYRSFVEELDRNLALRGVTDPGARATLINTTLVRAEQRAFAPELYFGLKMDINRPFGDGQDNGDSNDVVDDPGEEVAAINTDAIPVLGSTAEAEMDLNYDLVRNAADASEEQNPRVIFARNLYMLAMLLLDPVVADLNGDGTVNAQDGPEFAQAMAQWAVNVVDFRDPDSIHTRFVYDPTPFEADGWNPDGTSFVWGCERPELLISEPLVGHNRNTEDRPEGGGTVAVDPAGGPSDTNGDFDQRLRPEAFAYFELYNPWVQNSLNQTFAPELYNNQGVQLTRVNNFDAPVWRFEVERIDPTGTDEPKPLRYVYMADPTMASITYNAQEENQVPADIEVFYPSNPGNVNVNPGTHAVVGTQGFADGNEFRTFLGRRKTAVDTGNAAAIELDTTTHLSFDPTAGTVTRYNALSAMSETRNAGIVLIDQAAQLDAMAMVDATTAGDRQFSLSDPYEGYPDEEMVDGTFITNGDGFIYSSIRDQPLDRTGQTDPNRDDGDLLKILVTNGLSKDFRTIRLQRLANPLIAWDPVTNPYLTIDSMEADLISYNGAHDAATVMEPGMNAPDSDGAVSHERGFGTTVERQLWTARRSTTPAAGTTGDTTHNFDQDLVESLGKTNDAYLMGTQSFPWLTWNNRPFVSHMEIMNVPYLAPDRLTYAPENSTATTFSVDDGMVANAHADTRPGSGALAGRYGHLLNFFASGDGSAATNDFADAYRLLDYLEVPSRFVGNESWYLTDSTTGVLRHPFNTISHYRVPGKININTIPPTSTGVTTSLVWDALAAEYRSSLNWVDLQASLLGNPIRPAATANLVPGVSTTIPGSDCTLLRPDATRTAPLFDYDSQNASDNTDRSAAFRNGFRTRLGNMVTTKSSVFAGWVTVGFFEVDENDAVTPLEIGVDSGEQVRHRGFFIFDRSIPVAYEPGKNHNIEKAIRVMTIIE